MADQELSLNDVRKMAAEIGLTRLTDEQLEQLARATRAARARRGVLAEGALAPAVEPAHVSRLDGGDK